MSLRKRNAARAKQAKSAKKATSSICQAIDTRDFEAAPPGSAKEHQDTRLQSILKILEYETDSLQDFLDHALDEIILLTKSKLGYIYFYDEGKQEFILNTWSKDVLGECRIVEPQTRYQLAKTGLWGETVRQRRPIIENNFPAANPYKKGYPEGHVQLLKFLTVPVFYKGQIVAVVGVANKESDYAQNDILDISLVMNSIWKTVEIRAAEQTLRESEERFRFLLESTAQAVWETDADGRTVWESPTWRAYTGQTLKEVLGYGWIDAVHPDDRDRILQSWQDAVAEGRTVDAVFRLRSRDGSWRWSNVRATPVQRADGTIAKWVGMNLDITKRKQMEEELARAKDDLFRRCFDNMQHPFAIVRAKRNKSGVISDFDCEYANRAALQYLGITLDQLQQQTLLEGWPLTQDDGLFDKLCRVVESGEPLSTSLAGTYGQDPHVIYSYDINSIKLDDSQLAVFWQDTTDQKKMDAELKRLDRLGIVGEMAASIGHEVRNPLTTVRGYLQMFQMRKDFAGYGEQLATMIEELDRANDIISEFLSMAKNKTIERQEGNLNAVLDVLFPLIQADALRQGHETILELGDIPPNRFDAQEMRQLILNLTRNGLEAMEKSGSLTIRTYGADDAIILEVQDTGNGIAAHIMKELGKPFVTTKEKGTGLGLPVCYRIAERHNAEIALGSSVQGTLVRVKFKI